MNRFFQALLHPAEDADPQLRSELRGMMPGMLVEQFASTLLDNVNVIVMGLSETPPLPVSVRWVPLTTS